MCENENLFLWSCVHPHQGVSEIRLNGGNSRWVNRFVYVCRWGSNHWPHQYRRDTTTTRRPPIRTPEGKAVKRKGKKEKNKPRTPSPRCTSKGQRLTEDQRSIIRATRKGANIFFTGSAGTGKSLLLRHLRDILPSSSTYVTATTGVAACAIGGTTLHHFAGAGLIEPTSTVSSLASRVLKNSSACTSLSFSISPYHHSLTSAQPPR